jgi:hypothetical protein
MSSDGFWCPRMPGYLSLVFSDLRAEYIIKKYVERRWVASSTVPVLPLDKHYRRQEIQVIDLMSSGYLTSKQPPTVASYPIKTKSFKLLKREVKPRGIEVVKDAIFERLLDAATNSPSQDLFIQSIELSTNGTSHGVPDLYDAIEDDFGFTIPDSFQYQPMSPITDVTEASVDLQSLWNDSGSQDSHPLVASQDSLLPYNFVDDVKSDLIIMVKDVGIQTD